MARRGENIYKRKDGRWEARYIKGYSITGQTVYGYIYKRSYSEAKQAQAEARTNCAKQMSAPKPSAPIKTLEEHLTIWLESIKMGIKKSTFANYEGLIRRHIIPCLGCVPVKQLNNQMFQDYFREKLEKGRADGTGGLSTKTARDIAGILKRSLKSAGVEMDITLPKYSLPKLRVLSPEEQSALVMAAKEEEGMLGTGVLISLFTGIRIGELCSLKWENISFSNGVLTIDKTLQRIKNYDSTAKNKTLILIDTPKSERSVRNIPLPNFLLCHLAACKKHASDTDYILSGNQHYVEPRRCQYGFKKLIQKAGIHDINYHALRHTFATRCVELGIDIKTISELLGHSNVNVTLNRYVHPAFEHQRSCLERLSVSFS